ncbi:MAG TPA: vWA domain-containing protein [Pyrinomonadaceae bacterium]|nr:vWA domain-containing protein [Pyrinomonadaceae bacterium]
MYTDSLMAEGPVSGTFVLPGAVRDAELSQPGTSIRLDRKDMKQIWSKDPFQTGGFVVQQSVEERRPNHLNRIVIVVDTSASMSEWSDEIREAMRSLPPQFDVKLVFAEADDAYDNIPIKNLTGYGPEEMATALRSASFVGGADNAPALLKAWELAAERPGNNAIVWIHSPQLLQLKPVEELRQRWERHPYGPLLYSVPVTNGSDEIEKRLDGINEVKLVPRMDRLRFDLERLFAQLTSQTTTLEFVRSSRKMDQRLDLTNAYQTSDHLARLWANDEVTRILTARDQSLNDAATTLAVRYQLVTPVSGAVVLETAEQYRAAGLQPVEPGTVPTIPEPEIAVLMLVAGVFLILLTYVKYRARRRGGCVV